MTMPEEGTATSPGAPADNPENDVTAGGCVALLALLVLVAGLLGVAIGGFFALAAPSKPDPDNVRCGDDIMAPGDTCIAFGGGPDENIIHFIETDWANTADPDNARPPGTIALTTVSIFFTR